jgi:hypothetical protein
MQQQGANMMNVAMMQQHHQHQQHQHHQHQHHQQQQQHMQAGRVPYNIANPPQQQGPLHQQQPQQQPQGLVVTVPPQVCIFIPIHAFTITDRMAHI